MKECIICNHTTAPYFEKNGYTIVRCSECNLMAVANQPTSLEYLYGAGYFTGDVSLEGYVSYDEDKDADKLNHEYFVRAVRNALGTQEPKPRLLEIGCATGVFMEAAVKNGWRAEGIDISDYAVAEACRKGLRAQVGTLQTMNTEQNQYDAIVLFDVIEHVQDPRCDLARIYSLLKPGGVVCMGTPDAGSWWARVWGRAWHAFVPPQHLYYFSKHNLTELCAQQGFAVVRTENRGKNFRLPYIIRLLRTWTKLSIWDTVLHTVNKHSITRSITIPINVGDTMYIIARK